MTLTSAVDEGTFEIEEIREEMSCFTVVSEACMRFKIYSS